MCTQKEVLAVPERVRASRLRALRPPSTTETHVVHHGTTDAGVGEVPCKDPTTFLSHRAGAQGRSEETPTSAPEKEKKGATSSPPAELTWLDT